MSTKREMIERELEQREVELEDMQHDEAVVYSDDHERRLMIEIERLERELAKLPKQKETIMSNKTLGTITAVLEGGYEIDGDFVVSSCHIPCDAMDLEKGDKLVYWEDEYGIPRAENQEDGGESPASPIEGDDKLREFESKKKVGKVTSSGKCSITVDEYHTVSRTHLPWGSTELEKGDKVVYWTDEDGTPRSEDFANYEPEDGEEHPVDAQLREKLGDDVVDKVIDSLPNFAEKSAPEGTGTHLKDALRDQRGQIESEFVVYGFCVLLFLGILISGLCGKYDAPQKETTPFKELVKTVQYTPKSKPSLHLEDFQANDVEHFVERVRCHNYYQRMVNNGMVSLDDAKYALDHGFECGNELKI